MNPEQQNNLQPAQPAQPISPAQPDQPVQPAQPAQTAPAAPPVPLNFTAPPVETDTLRPEKTGISDKKKQKKLGIIIGSVAVLAIAVISTIMIINANKKEEKIDDNPNTPRQIDIVTSTDEKQDEDDDDQIPEGMQREKVADLKSGKIRLNYLDDSTGQDATMSEDDEATKGTVLYDGAYFVDGSYVSIKSGTFSSNVENRAVFVVANGGILKLSKDVKVNKTASGINEPDTSLAELGTNAAIVVFGDTSKVYINGTEINTTAKSSKAIYGAKGAKIDIKNAVINTTNSASSGISTTFGAELTINASLIKTGSTNSPAIESKFGAGSIAASNLNITTNGLGSPLVSTVSDVTLDSVSGSANGSQMLIIEGQGSVSANDSKISANGHGNTKADKDSKEALDNAGILFRKSLKNEVLEVATGIDSEPVDTPASFSAKNSELTILTSSNIYSSTPLFNALEKNANILIENTQAFFDEESVLLKATGSKVDYSDKNFSTPNKYYKADENSVITGLEEMIIKKNS